MASTGDIIAKQYRLDKEISTHTTHTLFQAFDSSGQTEVLVRVFQKSQIADFDGLHLACKKLQDLGRKDIETPIAFGLLEDGDFYFVTEKAEGVPFNEIIPKDEGLSIESAWPLIKQVGSALSVAHECGLYHLNLSPTKILVQKDADQNESIVVTGLGFSAFLKTQSSAENKASIDANAFAQVINFSLQGHKADRSEIFSSVASVIDSYSEKHRAAILVKDPPSETPEASTTSPAESTLGRFLIVAVVVTLMAATATLYYWLTTSS